MKTKFTFLSMVVLALSFLGACVPPGMEEPASSPFVAVTVPEEAQPLGAPVALSPKGSFAAANPLFQWQADAGATDYWLLMGDGPDFGTNNWLINAQDIPGTSYQSSNLSLVPNQTYYWKVKSIFGSTPGTWSPLVSFTYTPPNSVPIPLRPIDDIFITGPVFEWTKAAGAAFYWLLVMDGPDAGSSKWIINNGDVRTTNYSTPQNTFQVNKTYYWKVKALQSNGTGAWSSMVSFTVKPPNNGTYIGAWDLNGDGKAQPVFQHATRIDVLQPNNTYRQYSIGSGTWSIKNKNVTNLDGTAGSELIIVTATSIKVIIDRQGAVRTYNLGSSFWSMKGTYDLDGQAGNEILIVTDTAVKVITCRTNGVRTYSLGSSFWSYYTVVDLDGQTGLEIIIQRQTSILVICHRTGATRTYNAGSGGVFWKIKGTGNTDGVAGNEIIVEKTQGIDIVCDRTRSTRHYTVSTGFWAFIIPWLNDTNGSGGLEIILQTATAIVIVDDSHTAVRTYPIGSSAWVVERVVDYNSYPGMEILIRMPDSSLKIICDYLGRTY